MRRVSCEADCILKSRARLKPRHMHSSSKSGGAGKPKFKWFHVRGTDHCPYCVMLKGAIMMHLHTTAKAKLDKHVCFHDRDTEEGRRSWAEEVAHVVPASHTTIPCVVAEFSDGSLKFIGGLDRFVAMLGCPMKD